MMYQQTARGFVIRIESGEPIIQTLFHFCDEREIYGGMFIGLGALRSATIGMYDMGELEYRFQVFDTPHEITNLTGNISRYRDEIMIHAHITIADEEQRAFGGHLEEATAEPTCEIFLEDIGRELSRTLDATSRLALLDLEDEEHEA